MSQNNPRLSILLWVTLLNYAAQVPYYLYNYYFPYRVPPTPSSIVLLGLTLFWFLLGYAGFQRGAKFGFSVLASFLVVEALFYLHSFVFGAFFFQIQNPNMIIKLVFIYGYVSGAAAAWYAYMLIRNRRYTGLYKAN